MALAFENYLNPDYAFNTEFQKETAKALAAAYMEHINSREIRIAESLWEADLNGDGDTDDGVMLSIEYDPEAYPETNGYYGTYLNLYLAEFTQSLQSYLDRLAYAEDWTWFNAAGEPLSDSEVAAMTGEDMARAFIEGRYAKGSTASDGPGGGTPPSMNGSGNTPSGTPPTGTAEAVGTPDAGTTQAAGSGTDSANYASYDEMLKAYSADIGEILEGDAYGRNIVELYDPLRYIGAEGTGDPVWTRILMGAAEGDISMFSSLNLELAWLAAGTHAELEWQWDGGHVPSEVLGDSFSLYVDQMYARYASKAVDVERPAASPLTANGTATAATGTDLTSWVDYADISRVSFDLEAAANYRTANASKAIPAFDVIDYGQEDYVFGDTDSDARHWSSYVLSVFEAGSGTLEPLFNSGAAQE